MGASTGGGGGKRAALWAFSVLQTADSLSGGKLMNHSVLITGASGGLIGASFFRELKLRQLNGENINPHSEFHRKQISTDNLNPMIFSLLANDLFVGFTKFEYAGNFYLKDRGYTFEEQLNQITGDLMDKPIVAYSEDELKARIPMMIFSPTIVNDGRKLYIASRPVSFLNYGLVNSPEYKSQKFSGVDFQRLFAHQGADSLRFLSALRMCATFPYITPNTTLPSQPSIHIMDAGISDNFGLTDATRFLYAYRDWIAENTSGVVFTLEMMAGLYVATGKPEQAARLIGWADVTRQQIDDRRPLFEQTEIDQMIAACLIKIGEIAFSDAYEKGQKMTLDEAVTYVLKEN